MTLDKIESFDANNLTPEQTGKIAAAFVAAGTDYVQNLSAADTQKLMAVLEVFYSRFRKRYEDIKSACLDHLTEDDIKASVPVHVEGTQTVAFSITDVLNIAVKKGNNKVLKEKYSFSDSLIKKEVKEMYVKDDDLILQAYQHKENVVLDAIKDGILPDPQTWVTQKKSVKVVK